MLTLLNYNTQHLTNYELIKQYLKSKAVFYFIYYGEKLKLKNIRKYFSYVTKKKTKKLFLNNSLLAIRFWVSR